MHRVEGSQQGGQSISTFHEIQVLAATLISRAQRNKAQTDDLRTSKFHQRLILYGS